MTGRHFAAFAAASALIVIISGASAFVGVRLLTDGESRQDVIAARGARVMPFDLDKTMHVFEKTEDGGIQTVTVIDPAHADQIPLIRAHLENESERFRAGDFSDPASIHGADMPGLEQLASADSLAIEYERTAYGAKLTYASSDAAVLAALHAWFDAQISDHGRHANQ